MLKTQEKFGMHKLRGLLLIVLGSGLLGAADWLTDGGDIQRTGWQKDEHILTPDNVKNLKILWKVETGNQPRALHNLMPVLVVNELKTSSGPKQIAIVSGISDNLYAIDVETGKIIWQKHFEYPPPPARPNAGPANTPPTHLNFLNPGGSSDTPVIGPPDANGKRTVYMVDGGGTMHSLNVADGEDMRPPFPFVPSGTKGWALQLIGNTIWMPGGGTMAAVDLSGQEPKVFKTVGLGRSGGLWGRRGATVDSAGVAWTTTGDGQYNPKDPNNLILANSIVGFEIQGDHLHVKDWFTPANWEWLLKRDLDPNNTPTLFNFKGRELIAASGKECRMFLLDPKNAGGADHHTPLYRTQLFCNEDVDFQDKGSWGALSTWEDSDSTRWVLAPFWGPVHSKFKFPIVNTPVTKEGGVAAFKVEEKNGSPILTPAWVSRDMFRGEPPVIANGIVFAFGSGDFTQQASPENGLDFDSSIRAAKANHTTIYALDAKTGKELYSSGDQMPTFNHFTGLTVANGRVYLGTYDGALYCFGLPDAK